jgi:TonB family protein
MPQFARLLLIAIAIASAASPGQSQTQSPVQGTGPSPQPEPLPANPAKANPFQPGQKLLGANMDLRPVPEPANDADRCDPSRDRKSNGILSHTGGVDFTMYISQVSKITDANWIPLIPKEVDKPFYKTGEVKVCFSVLPTGKIEAESLLVAQTSGDPALDRAATGAIATAIFPPLPKDYAGNRLTVLFTFEYNPDRHPDPVLNLPKPPNPLGPIAVTVGYTSKL